MVNVLHTTGIIDNRKIRNIVIKRIHTKIATPGIIFNSAVDIVPYNHAIAHFAMLLVSIFMVSSKSGNFYDFSAKKHMS